MNKYTVVVLLAFAVYALAARTEQEYQKEFVEFMHTHQKSYAHDEFQSRYSTFKANMDIIDNYNARGLSFTLAMNKFGDLGREEFKRLYTGLKNVRRGNNTVYLSTDNLPDSVDWRKSGAVTPVKDQGQCGSCWSFSTTGSLEGLNYIKSKKLVSFSEQQLVDCSQSYGNQGCDGGLMDDAFQYVAAQGIETEADYPYTAEDGTCAYSKSKTVFKNKAYTDVPQDTPLQLQAAVAQQPVSVAIEADQSCFQFYSGGVLSYPSCGDSLDHGVLVVGYGTASGTPYWIVKNSWGASWGEQGYIRIARSTSTSSDEGECGIDMMPSYPTA
jgi:C1A family cysteine protease